MQDAARGVAVACEPRASVMQDLEPPCVAVEQHAIARLHGACRLAQVYDGRNAVLACDDAGM